jgi:hypothetical protein
VTTRGTRREGQYLQVPCCILPTCWTPLACMSGFFLKTRGQTSRAAEGSVVEGPRCKRPWVSYSRLCTTPLETRLGIHLYCTRRCRVTGDELQQFVKHTRDLELAHSLTRKCLLASSHSFAVELSLVCYKELRGESIKYQGDRYIGKSARYRGQDSICSRYLKYLSIGLSLGPAGCGLTLWSLERQGHGHAHAHSTVLNEAP